MSSQETSVSKDTFLDRWGHWVLWMGPFIAAVSILAWTPLLLPLLVGVEIVQFTVHTSRHHPTHPMSDILPMFLGGVLLIVSAALIPATMSMWLLALVASQIGLSSAVHRWFHRDLASDVFQRGQYLLDIWTWLLISSVAIFVMLGDDDVPGFPLLHTFLL